jgi:hypothetical protein
VQLECEQSQNYCFFVTPTQIVGGSSSGYDTTVTQGISEDEAMIRLGSGGDAATNSNDVPIAWPFLLEQEALSPAGQSPAHHLRGRTPSPARNVHVGPDANAIAARLALFWRASIVNADGSVSQLQVRMRNLHIFMP